MNAFLTPSLAVLSLLFSRTPAYAASLAMAQMDVRANPADMALNVFDKDTTGDGVNNVWHASS